jgi:hypothetical protein
MSQIERLLRTYSRGYNADPDAVTTPYPERVLLGRAAPYRFGSDDLLEFAQETTKRYLELVEICEGTRSDLCTEPPTPGEPRTLDDENVPRPPSTLRAVPPV